MEDDDGLFFQEDDDGVWKRASHHVSLYFSQPVADHLLALSDFPLLLGAASIIRVVSQIAAEHINLDLSSPPTSVEAFLSSTRHILSEFYQESFRQHASAFDRLAENTIISESCTQGRLSDFFIQQHSSRQWLFMIINNVAAHSREIAKSELSMSRDGRDQESPAVRSNLPSSHQRSSPALTEAGPSNTSPGPSSPSNCPIVQIELRGHNLASAWNAHPIMRDLEQATAPEQAAAPTMSLDGSSWDPTRHPHLPVYHGTASHIDDRRGDSWRRQWTQYEATSERQSFSYLMGSWRNMNQVAPPIPTLPVVWTSFSAIRSFLWSVFSSDVIGHTPGSKGMDHLNRRWKCPHQNHVHTGVLLFKLRPQLPAPSGLSFWVMPRGREAAWATHCEHVINNSTNPRIRADQIWERFSGFHNGSTTTWPDVLHCREFGRQAYMLSAFTTQFWRTVWFDDGIRALNESHEATYAITISLQPKAPKKKDRPDPELGQDKTDHEDGDGDGALGRKKHDRARGWRAFGRRVLIRLGLCRH